MRVPIRCIGCRYIISGIGGLIVEYELISNPRGDKVLLHVPTGDYIPIDPGNADYQRFLIWNATQETPLVIEGE